MGYLVLLMNDLHEWLSYYICICCVLVAWVYGGEKGGLCFARNCGLVWMCDCVYCFRGDKDLGFGGFFVA